MILVSQKKLFHISGIVSILLIPFIFIGLPSWFTELEARILLFLVAEFAIFVITGMYQAGGNMFVPVLIYSALMIIIRSVMCLIAALMYFPFTVQIPLSDLCLNFWIGNPVSQFLQVFFILMYSPHLIARIAPGMIVDPGALTDTPPPPKIEQQRTQGIRENYFLEPIGGFIRTYSILELQTCFRKTIGLEGFLIFSNEGLIVWEDISISFDMEKLILKLMDLDKKTDELISEFDLDVNERIMIETPEHIIFNTKLDNMFYLVAFCNKKVNINEILPRIKVLTKSTSELLKSRYMALEIK